MVNVPVIVGNTLESAITCGPVPGIANAIVLLPPAAFASVIAWRSEPGPLSATLATVNIAASAGPATPSSSANAIAADRPLRPARSLRTGVALRIVGAVPEDDVAQVGDAEREFRRVAGGVDRRQCDVAPGERHGRTDERDAER